RPDATAIVAVDQFEEFLFTPGADEKGRGRADRFLAALRTLCELEGAPYHLLCTLRSDFLGAFQDHVALRGIPSETLVVEPLDVVDLPRVIEAPAALAGVAVEQRLVAEMVHDAESQDALPLLAFALRELYERYAHEGMLDLGHYREKLGGLQRAVSV